MTIVQRDQQMKDKAGFDYKKSVIPFLPDEVKEFEAEAVKYLNGGYANPDDFTKFRLVRGVYGQRQPNVQMMRIKLPGGYASPEQLEALGKVIEKFAPLKKGHITTRENVQIHHIPLEDTPEIMRMLGASGLSTREACGNTVRNVIGSPLTGVSPDEPFFVAPYLAAFVRWFVRHPHAQALPRKFKVAFASTPEDDVVTDIHDLGFLPRMQKGPDGRERKGFKIVAGGGTSIMARLAHTLYEFVPVEEYLRVSEAVVRIFNRTEELRKNRARARIKFYIDRVGIEAFRAEVEEELKQPWAKQNFDPTPLMEVPVEFQETPPAPVPAPRSDGHMEPEFLRWHKDNVQPQKQKGYNIVWVTLPLGDVRHDQFPVLARIAREYTGGNAHMTPDQNLLYR
jgi:sulfite reductase beta subunit-like hemoprotein